MKKLSKINKNKHISEKYNNSRLLTFQKRLQIFLSWRGFEFFIFILIVLYMVLVFATFAIEDPSLSTSIGNVDGISFVLKIIEIVILGIFCIEIMLKITAFGFKVYIFHVFIINILIISLYI